MTNELNQAEPERERAFTWMYVSLALSAALGLVTYLALWPIGQLLEPMGSARPAGFSAAWLEETRAYLGGVLPHLREWLPAIWRRFVTLQMTRTGLPHPILIAPLVAAGVGFAVMLRACPYEFRYKSQGRARWSTERMARRDGLFSHTGIVLGRTPLVESTQGTRARGRRIADLVRNYETLSAMLIAPPGTAKTVQLITNLLADWPDRIPRSLFGFIPIGTRPALVPGPSVIVNDPKGEIYDTTSAWRARLGPAIRLEWAALSGHSWNPLDPANYGGERLPEIYATLRRRLGEHFGAAHAERAVSGVLRASREAPDGWIERLTERPLLTLGANPPAGLLSPAGDIGQLLRDLYPLIVELHAIWNRRDDHNNRLWALLVPDTVEHHWRITGRAAGRGATGLIQARCERDPSLGEASFGMLNDWLAGMARQPFSGFAVSGGGRGADGEPLPGQVDVASLGLGPHDATGGDADDDLTARLLDDAIQEATEHGYPGTVLSDLNILRKKPDKERGSVISTMAAAIDIFKNAAVRQRTSSSTFRLSDIRGWVDPKSGRSHPVTIYVVVALKDAVSLGRVTSLFVESVSKLLLSEESDWVSKQKKAFSRHLGAGFAGGWFRPRWWLQFVRDIHFSIAGDWWRTWRMRPVLMLLDEFWTMEPMESLMQIPALGRGLWASVVIVGQSPRQIALKFGSQGENVLGVLEGAIHYKQYPAQNDMNSAKRLSEELGQKTVINESHSTSRGLAAKFSDNFRDNLSRSLIGVPLMRPEEIKELEKLDPPKKKFGWQVVTYGGARMLCRPACWFDMPELQRRAGRYAGPAGRPASTARAR